MDLFSYPFQAGYKSPTTSKDAAIAIEANGKSEALRKRVYDALMFHMTPKECAASLDIDINSVRPRITELKQRGMVKETGERRDRQHVYKSV